jgi:hypothetical protein
VVERVYEQTKIVVNENGKLLDHEGKVLELKYPLTKEERRLLMKEIREYL